MKQEEKRSIILENGEQAQATFPIIVSASRSTDIPAFYLDWFLARLKRGYSAWINPFNAKKSYISYQDTKFIVFWSKDPHPLLKHLDYLKERGIGCYIQFSLNDYEKDGLEPGVPVLNERIETFRKLVNKLGKGSVIWRFDPLLLTANIDMDTLLMRIRNIGEQIHDYTEKLVFSFADILSYPRVKTNLDKNRVPYQDWTTAQMREFAARLVELNKTADWNLTLATCGETAALDGITPNRCIDDHLILRLTRAPEVWKALGAVPCQPDLFGTIPLGAVNLGKGKFALIQKNNKEKKDKGQREACGCVKSKDIGQYGTCLHLCEYCYANYSTESVLKNHERHKANPFGELITG